MKNEFEDEPGQFKMECADDADSSAPDLNVDELRLEKISQRVTFISILIPVLIIIVLVIAYLDIKKRMTYTEDTGSMEVRKLSSDLESRFSSLSLRQAELEESLARFSNNQNQSLASSNIKLDKIEKTVTAMQGQYLTRKDFDQVREELTRRLAEVSENIDQADSQIAAMTIELKNQIQQIGQTLTERNQRLDEQQKQLAAMQKQILELDRVKIDTQSLDLKLKLTTLKIQEDYKIQLDSLQSDLKKLSSRMLQPATKPSPGAAPAPMESAAPPKSPAKTTPGKIEEQTIK